jgi:hypothetical protein
MKALLVIALLVACGDNIDEHGHSHGIEDQIADWLAGNGASHGTVYVCTSNAECLSEEGEPATEEWCYWEDSATELRDLLGATECHEITVGERWWPAISGCAYGCPLEGRGCNAHCGCYCP